MPFCWVSTCIHSCECFSGEDFKLFFPDFGVHHELGVYSVGGFYKKTTLDQQYKGHDNPHHLYPQPRIYSYHFHTIRFLKEFNKIIIISTQTELLF